MTIGELVERIRIDLKAGRKVWLNMSDDHAGVTVQLTAEDSAPDKPVFYSADGYSEIALGSDISILSVYRVGERPGRLHEFPACLAVTVTDAETEQEMVDVLLELRPGDEQYTEIR